MTLDDIIRMARKAGYGDAMSELHAPALERFAALVAAAEREACAKVCDELASPSRPLRDPARSWIGGTLDCAAAIRARGQE